MCVWGGGSFLLIALSFPLWLIVSCVSATPPPSPQVGGAAPKKESPESETPRFFHMEGGRIVITSRSLRAIGGLRPQLLYFPPSGRCFGLAAPQAQVAQLALWSHCLEEGVNVGW